MRNTVLTLLLLAILYSCVPTSKTDSGTQNLNPTLHDENELHEYVVQNEKDSLKLEYWIPIWNYYTEKGDYEKILDEAIPKFNSAAKDNDTTVLHYYGAYILQSYLFEEQFDSLIRYSDLLYLYDIEKNLNLSTFFNNILAIYSIKAELNYSKAVEYLQKGYEAAEKLDDIDNQIVILSNIASVYYLREDTLGIKYAEDALKISESPEAKTYYKCLANIAYSQMLMLEGDYDHCLEYVNNALEFSKEEHNASLRSTIYLVLAKIYMFKNNFIKSEYYYNAALEHSTYSEPGTIVEILFNYGNLMNQNGRSKDALELYNQALNISYKYKNVEHRGNILLAMSRLYKTLGNKEEAFSCYRLYHEYNDSLFNIQKERDFVSQQLYQQKQSHERELKEQELVYMKITQKMTIFICFAILLALILIIVVISYKHKLNTYSRLAKQHYVYMQRAKLSDECKPEKEYPSEKSDNDRIILRNLERLMKEEKIYRNKELTLEKVAEELNTNRTYLSHSINSLANMSFSHYINMYRVNEATEILSEPDFDMPLKQLADELGFNSQSVFYRAFQREIGCSPIRYRNEILKLKNVEK